MARKKWTPKEEITPELIRFREKRKWQISLRRYVLNGHPSTEYAPYFGLDIKSIRKWFEYQFDQDLSWENFAEKWQFDHVISLTYFDFASKEEMRLCWNFTNLRVERIEKNKSGGLGPDLLAAKKYFSELFERTQYTLCKRMVGKIAEIESSESLNTEKQQEFIIEHKELLDKIENFTSYEFEQLNAGSSIDEINKEADFLKNIKNRP